LQVSSRTIAALVALCLLMLAGCDRSEPPPGDFVLSDPRSQQISGEKASLDEAKEACQSDTRRNGYKSIFAIVSRLRKGSASEDYIACMKNRGYDVAN
jgi:hypothetical protein